MRIVLGWVTLLRVTENTKSQKKGGEMSLVGIKGIGESLICIRASMLKVKENTTSFFYNRIYNKILVRDWISARLFVT